jgi:hypothetical protein
MEMLEDIQDRKAYPPTWSRPTYKTEEEYAAKMRLAVKAEGHRKRMPVNNPRSGLAVDEKTREERVLGALQGKTLSLTELAEAIGIWPGQAHDYLRPLIASGQVLKHGDGHYKKYSLAD